MPWPPERASRRTSVVFCIPAPPGTTVILIPPGCTPPSFLAPGLEPLGWVRAQWRSGASPAQDAPDSAEEVSVAQVMPVLGPTERNFVLRETDRAIDRSFEEGWVGPGDDRETKDARGRFAAAGLRLQLQLSEWSATQLPDESRSRRRR